MDFSRRRVKLLSPEEGELAELYPHDLQWYTSPPTCEISLSEFEQLAVDRLKVLRLIEQTTLNGHAKNSEEWRKAIADELKKHSELKNFYKVITSYGAKSKEPDYAARKADHLSHFILRLSFCQTEELRRWFISRELELFRLRWLNLSAEGKSDFFKLNHLNYEPISKSERLEVSEKSNGAVSSSADYYRVPFTQVLDLVRLRKVYLQAGAAYITAVDIISVLLTLYRTRLSYDLSKTARILPVLEATDVDRERIFRPLKALPHAYIGEDYSSAKTGDKIPIKCIDSAWLGGSGAKCTAPVSVCQENDPLHCPAHRPSSASPHCANLRSDLGSAQALFKVSALYFHNHIRYDAYFVVRELGVDGGKLARQSFPLCMRQLHAKLRQDHKLRHGARLQYALFLKGIGVTLEDIMTMWREEWAKVEPEKFEKGGVSYLLRHSYGKEGKRTNYTPQSCIKIINGSVGTGDQHGCPFKHNDVSAIRLILTQSNVSANDVQETVDLIKQGQYQLACTKYFDLTHGMPPERFIVHPNQYFEESQNIKKGKADGSKRVPVTSSESVFSKSDKNPTTEKDVWDEVADDDLMNIDV